MNERSTKDTASFANGVQQIQALYAQCNDITHLTIISNALRTARRVLGTNMPLADDAHTFEQRIQKVLDKAMKSLAKLQMKNENTDEHPLVTSVKEIVKKSQ